jgi:hypothetical protein
MRTVLVVLVVCAALDTVACGLLLLLAWAEYRRVRKEAVAAGEPRPLSAVGQFGCLAAAGLVGLILLYGAVWLLLRE